YKDFVDIILIDTPPCAFMHDTALVARYADLGLMIIRQDYAHTNRVLTAIENLSHTGLDLVGYVINGESTGIGSYGYGKYGYGRYGYSGRYGHYGYYGKQDKKDKKTE
ncbi:MAG: hypothetical protein PUB22_05030, partial [Clostridiales bacterium]|nr:hypothetical protein [Clostridiales bacterium]